MCLFVLLQIFNSLKSLRIFTLTKWIPFRFGIDKLFFRLSNLFDLFDQCDSQRMLPVLVKWACFLFIWEQLIDCLMLIMMRFTLRECQCTKERYILQLSYFQRDIILTFSYCYLAIVIQI